MATSVQYGIRHLIGLTLAVAVVAAVSGQVIRSCDPERRMPIIVFFAVAMLSAAGGTFYQCVRRVRAERAAGEVLLRVGAFGSHPMNWVAALIGFLVVALLGIWVLYDIPSEDSDEAVQLAVVLGCVPAMVAPQFLTPLWWGLEGRSIEMCERGVILGAVLFLPYSRLNDYRWSRVFRNKLILYRRIGNLYWEVKLHVPSDEGPEICRLLEEHGVPPDAANVDLR